MRIIIAGYLLCTGDKYREHHDHIWTVLQRIELSLLRSIIF